MKVEETLNSAAFTLCSVSPSDFNEGSLLLSDSHM